MVHGSQVTMDHVGWKYRPQGLTSAQLNLSFCVATLLLEGDCFVDQFNERVVTDPARMALAQKVEVRADPAITRAARNSATPCASRSHLRDGRVFECALEAPRGSEPDFASEAKIVAKFEKLAAHALGARRLRGCATRCSAWRSSRTHRASRGCSCERRQSESVHPGIRRTLSPALRRRTAQAPAPHRPLARRRHGRRRRARDRAEILRRPGPRSGDREQGRRGRLDRPGGGRQGAGGRRAPCFSCSTRTR